MRGEYNDGMNWLHGHVSIFYTEPTALSACLMLAGIGFAIGYILWEKRKGQRGPK